MKTVSSRLMLTFLFVIGSSALGHAKPAKGKEKTSTKAKSSKTTSSDALRKALKVDSVSTNDQQGAVLTKVKAEVKANLGDSYVKKIDSAKSGKELGTVLKSVTAACSKCSTSRLLSTGLIAGGSGEVQSSKSSCGVFHCLSIWGCHFPCRGIPETPCNTDDGDGEDNCDKACSVAHPECHHVSKSLCSRECIECVASAGAQVNTDTGR